MIIEKEIRKFYIFQTDQNNIIIIIYIIGVIVIISIIVIVAICVIYFILEIIILIIRQNLFKLCIVFEYAFIYFFQ